MNSSTKPSQPHLNQPTATRLIATLFLSLAVRLLLGHLARSDYRWQTHDVAMHFNACLLLWVLYSYANAHRSFASSIIAGWVAFELISLGVSLAEVFQIDVPRYLVNWQLALLALCCLIHQTLQKRGD